MKKKIFIWIIAALALAGCGKLEKAPIQSPAIKVKRINVLATASNTTEEAKPYIYHGDMFRDPFVPITAELAAQNDNIVVPNINDLVLHGIVRDGSQSIALLKSGSNSYTLLNGRVYDPMQRLIKGLSGIIKSDSIVITGSDGTSREIKFRENEIPH